MYLTQFVRRAAQTAGQRIATRFEGRTHSYDRFADRVARLAAGLRGLGVKDNDRVGILALNSDRYLEFFFAVPWAGGVFVPINTRLAPPEFVFWITDPECTVLFVDDAFLEVVGKIRAEIACVKHLVYVGDGAPPAGMLSYEGLIEGAAAGADAGRGYEDLAGIFYTGGTTGRSKGVMLSHRNLVSGALNGAIALDMRPEATYLHAAPMFHLADGTQTFGMTMMAGSHRFLARFDPEAVLQTIDAEKITDTLIVPTMINMVVNHPKVGDYDISTLQRIAYGASPMPEALIRKALQVMPKVRFRQAYGQTECAPLLTATPPEVHDLDGPLASKLKSCGIAAPGCEVRILDPQGNEVPRGEVGEICARGPNIMVGYWKQPEVTANTIRNGWIYTGDGGYMDGDGFVYIVDRVKDMIISGGENVYSAEVENAIYRHPAVVECAVIGVPDDKWGERVHAIVRLKPGETLTEAQLIDHCKALIANYKCPRSADFKDDPFPLSGAGKILKTELRKPYWAGQTRNVN